MSTKLIQTKDYLLLINEETEIKEGSIAIYDFGMGYDLEIPCDKDNLKSNTRKLVVAYYPLTKEAKELDLPLLPEHDIEGFRIIQSKQFSLDDMKKAFFKGRESLDKALITDIEAEEIVQSLSTQQLPKEFIPEYVNEPIYIGDGCHKDNWILKTITNSEGKEVLVGTYKY